MTRPLSKFAPLTLALALLAVAAGCQPEPNVMALDPTRLSVVVVNVGQGDAALVVAPNGDTMLIDAGEPDPAEDALIPLLQQLLEGAQPFDVVIASHFDYDHVGGTTALYEAGWFDGSTTFYDPGERGEASAGVYRYYQDSTRGAAAQLTPEPGDRIAFGGDEVTVAVLASNGRIHPAGSQLDSGDNGRSLAVMIQMGLFDLSTGGDLTTDVAEPLANTGAFAGTDVFRAHHHGSRHGNTRPVLQAASPQVVLVSVGNAEGCGPGYSRYGHPAQNLLDALGMLSDLPYLVQTETGGIAVNESAGNCITESWDSPRSYGSLVTNTAGGHILVETDGSTFAVKPQYGEATSYTAR